MLCLVQSLQDYGTAQALFACKSWLLRTRPGPEVGGGLRLWVVSGYLLDHERCLGFLLQTDPQAKGSGVRKRYSRDPPKRFLRTYDRFHLSGFAFVQPGFTVRLGFLWGSNEAGASPRVVKHAKVTQVCGLP